MVLGAILGTILASKSHPEIDQKIDQILDGFWKDFGSQMESKLGPFWLQKSIKNQSRFLNDFWRIPEVGSAPEAWPVRVLFFAQRLIYLDIEYDNVFYTPNAPVGCGGGFKGYASAAGPFGISKLTI